MVYKILQRLPLLFLSAHLCAQPLMWNRELPVAYGYGPSDCSVQWIEGKYLFCGRKSIVELDPFGFMTSTAIAPASEFFATGSFLRVRKNALTGERYFLIGYRKNSAQTALYFAEYRPGTGLKNATLFEDDLGVDGLRSIAPAVVDLNDSTFVVFGGRWVREIVHRPGQGFLQLWQKSIDVGSVQAALRTKDGFVTVSQNGTIAAFDEKGNEKWAKSLEGHAFNNIKPALDDGFWVCGKNVDLQKAIVLKLDKNGEIQWDKTYEEDTFNGLVVRPDGGIAVSGETKKADISLVNLASNGNLRWRKTYQRGRGHFLMAAEDGGYLLAGASNLNSNSSTRFGLLKTDGDGNTLPVESMPDLAYRNLENEMMSARFMPAGSLFYDGTTLEPNFFIPKALQTTTYYATGLWMNGMDDDHNAHSNQITYTSSPIGADYRPGMVNAPEADFRHAWYVNRRQIEALRADWSDNGKLDAAIPGDILRWPSRGNVDFGANMDFTQTSTNPMDLMAPFVDANGDGLYRVADGDYPRLKGDQMCWWVITDDTPNALSKHLPFGCDIAVAVYMFDCSDDPLVEGALFVDYEIVNRSQKRYSDVYLRLWNDPDLGCGMDDYIGTLTQSNAIYVYNQDTPDVHCGRPSFGDEIPVAAVTFLNATLVGHSKGDMAPTNSLLYPGNPADPNGVSMCTQNVPMQDQRSIASVAPITMSPNDTVRFRLAFSYHADVPHPCPDIFGRVKSEIDRLRDLDQSGALGEPLQLPPLVTLQAGQSALLDATLPGATAYHWSTGSTAAQLNVTQAGVYTVAITRVTGCPLVETVTVRLASHADETSQVADFRLFPNPNKGQFQVELRGKTDREAEFTLFNAIGQVVRTDRAGFENGILSKALDYGHLASGIYTLRTRVGSLTYAERVVVTGN